jgi:elongation factor P
MFNFQDIRNGAKLEINGEPFVVTYFQHVNPGKGSAFVRTKIRSLITGNVIDRTFKAGDKIDSADLEVRHMQFLYKVGSVFHFMDNETTNSWKSKVRR